MKKIFLAILMFGLIFTTKAQYVWTQKANFPGNARTQAACFSIGHYGYVGCGANGFNTNSPTYSDWWRWDQNINLWSSVTSYPGAGQFGCTCFSINGKGYVGLGCSNAVCKTDLWSYDTSTNAWTQMASFPGRARYGGRAFVIGTNAYLCSGSAGGLPYLSDCWKYNSISNTWSQIESYPLANSGTTLTYSIGKYGYSGSGSNSYTLNGYMYQYDTTSNTWSAIDSLPYGIGVQSYFVLGDTTAYSVTGNNMQNEYLHEVFSYNPNANTWIPLNYFSGIPCINGVGFTIGNMGYIATGYDSLGDVLNDLWQYGPAPEGINTISTTSNIQIYPNPAKNQFTVQLSVNSNQSTVASPKWSISIYNITGQELSEQSLNTQNSILNTQAIPDGVYFLMVQMSDGSRIVKKVEIIR